MNQRGFATLEVILMVMVIGILASIAVPRFTSVTAAANTAKIQSDLSTIDTAIAVYQMEKGSAPSGDISVLKDYIRGAEDLKPPTGKCFIEGEEKDVPTGDYAITASTNESNESETRATLGGNTAEKFYTQKKSNSTNT